MVQSVPRYHCATTSMPFTSLTRMCANAFPMPEFAPVTTAVGILAGTQWFQLRDCAFRCLCFYGVGADDIDVLWKLPRYDVVDLRTCWI
jgi:hypothetical protein